MTESTSTDLTVLGQSLQNLYTIYSNNIFQVNRRYQRKLVWSVDEKESLIDSINGKLPIPLVLLAESSAGGSHRLEIIDGLQRLNAIFSFIENEFSYNGSYFDLETLADTKLRRDKDIIKQRNPKLDRETCVAIVNYQLPVSTYRSATEESVDEVFRRINSSGRKLSLQEIRQAGVTSEISGLVRRISASVRGDASLNDVLPLSEMPKISITNQNLDYGICSDEVFWVKNGILDKDAVRESRDEELVLDILLDMVISPIPVSGSTYRNSAYGREDNATTSAGTVDARVVALGADNVERDFLAALDVVKRAIDKSGSPWASWVKDQKNPRGLPRYFHATFVSIHEILAEGYEIEDIDGFTAALEHFWDRDLTIPGGGGNWGANRKRPLFDSVKAMLIKFFRKIDNPAAVRARETATEFEIQLQMALTEESLFELKQGFVNLDGNGEFDDKSFEKIMRTASAMANLGKDAHGYIFFGVADTRGDLDRVVSIYGVDPLEVNGFHVVGTDHELGVLGRSRDEHMQWLVQRIRNSKLEESFASQLSASLSLFDYKGYSIWALRPEATGNGPVSWDGKFYVREGNSTNQLQGSQVTDLMRRLL